MTRGAAAGPSGQPTVVLVASPLLGPAVWDPVRDLLLGMGWRVLVAAPAGDSPEEVLQSLLSQLPDDVELVLVPHSNAGLYVGCLAAQRDVRAVLFVDAGIPAQRGPTPTAPVQALDYLQAQADEEGRLPPWTQWWPEEDVAPLFPDQRARAAVERQQSRLPLAYFRTAVPPAPGWARMPCGYLAFGDTYAAEVARAEQQGWPMSRIEGRHLHMLVDPPQVAAEIDALLRQLR